MHAAIVPGQMFIRFLVPLFAFAFLFSFVFAHFYRGERVAIHMFRTYSVKRTRC